MCVYAALSHTTWDCSPLCRSHCRRTLSPGVTPSARCQLSAAPSQTRVCMQHRVIRGRGIASLPVGPTGRRSVSECQFVRCRLGCMQHQVSNVYATRSHAKTPPVGGSCQGARVSPSRHFVVCSTSRNKPRHRPPSSCGPQPPAILQRASVRQSNVTSSVYSTQSHDCLQHQSHQGVHNAALRAPVPATCCELSDSSSMFGGSHRLVLGHRNAAEYC
jgi:hypothetical protein